MGWNGWVWNRCEVNQVYGLEQGRGREEEDRVASGLHDAGEGCYLSRCLELSGTARASGEP